MERKSPPNLLDKLMSSVKRTLRPVSRGLNKQVQRSNAGASNPKFKKPKK